MMKFTNDKSNRMTGLKLYDKKGNERVKIGQTKHSDEFVDTVGSEERAIGFWTKESKKGLIREVGLVVLKLE